MFGDSKEWVIQRENQNAAVTAEFLGHDEEPATTTPSPLPRRPALAPLSPRLSRSLGQLRNTTTRLHPGSRRWETWHWAPWPDSGGQRSPDRPARRAGGGTAAPAPRTGARQEAIKAI